MIRDLEYAPLLWETTVSFFLLLICFARALGYRNDTICNIWAFGEFVIGWDTLHQGIAILLV